jgi:hypothetical protein
VDHHQDSPAATLQDTTGTALAMALLWVIPVMAFVLALTRL